MSCLPASFKPTENSHVLGGSAMTPRRSRLHAPVPAAQIGACQGSLPINAPARPGIMAPDAPSCSGRPRPSRWIRRSRCHGRASSPIVVVVLFVVSLPSRAALGSIRRDRRPRRGPARRAYARDVGQHVLRVVPHRVDGAVVGRDPVQAHSPGSVAASAPRVVPDNEPKLLVDAASRPPRRGPLRVHGGLPVGAS